MKTRSGDYAPHTFLLNTLAASLLTVTVGCSDSSDNRSGPPDTTPPDAVAYNVTLHRTEGGIPHMIAEDWGSLGYGTGYAAAQDHFCELSLRVLKFRGRLSEALGPQDGNLDSDFFFQLVADDGTYDVEIDPELDAQFAGYAEGFNRYRRDTGVNNITDPACAGADWIPALTADDVRRAHLMPFWLPNFISLLLPAQPPAVVAVSDSAADSAVSGKGGAPAVLAAKPAPEMDEQEKLQLAAYARTTVNPTDKGSNGVAIGGELGSGEGGLLYTNPHISWTDFGFRMWALHQIIPGVTNMLGANQANRAHVGFGTNGNIAWTNTVSTAEGYMFYKLDLVPGNPMAYLFDAQERQIEPVEVTVPVKDDSGAVTEQSHTFYRSHFGYMLGGRFPWLTTLAFTIRFAEEGPRAMQGGALAYSRATTVRELKEAMNQYQTTPKITTIAADRSGEAMFGDLGPMVNFTDQQLQDCLFSSPVYLGNSSACEWNNDEDAAAPGLLGPGKQPFIYRQDYVTNSNDSYWLANPEQPLTGFPRVVGDVETERTMRTRSGLLMLQERQQGVDGLPGNTFDLDLLIDRMLSNQNMAARLLNDDLVTLCEANPSVTVDDASVDISEACPILAAWDRSANLDSRGEHLFREFMRAVRTEDDGPGAVPAAVKPQVLFDVNDPVNTPAGMDDTDNPASLQALAMAVQVLRDAGIALDARLGDLQSITRNGTPIPLHGGEQMEGIFNKMSMDFAGSEGYPDVTGSSASWVMATHVAGDNTRVKGLTAYSQSSDPTSEHYADMTERFSAKDLVDIPFLPEDVEAAAISTMNLEEGTAQCADGGWQNFEALGFADEAACRDYFVELYDNRITGFVDD